MNSSKKLNLSIRKQSDFFKRGRELANQIDRGKKIPSEKSIIFETAADFNKFISQKKIELLNEIRKEPCSISTLSILLNRNRAAVTRDVNELEHSGLVTTEMVVNAGHGRTRIVKPIAKSIILQIKI